MDRVKKAITRDGFGPRASTSLPWRGPEPYVPADDRGNPIGGSGLDLDEGNVHTVSAQANEVLLHVGQSESDTQLGAVGCRSQGSLIRTSQAQAGCIVPE